MNVLALELSSARGSVAFLQADAIAFEDEFANDRKHSGAFFSAVKNCREQLGPPDRIVVGLGPGSYAGVRIAIATATGLAAAHHVELVGLTSVAAINIEAEEYLVIGDARRGSYFFVHVRNGDCVAGPMLMNEEQLRARVAAADLPLFRSEPVAGFDEVPLAFPSAVRLARLSGKIAGRQPPLEPIYLRDPHITTAKRAVSFAIK